MDLKFWGMKNINCKWVRVSETMRADKVHRYSHEMDKELYES